MVGINDSCNVDGRLGVMWEVLCAWDTICIDPAPNLCAGSGMLWSFCVTLIIVNLVIVSNGEAYLQVTPRLLRFMQCMVLKALGRI